MSSARLFRVKNYLRGPYELGSEKFAAPPAPDNHWLPGDLIMEDGRVSRVRPPPLHGVLDLLNRTGQGFSPRGVPLYLFYPLDPAWPPFLIAFKERGTANLLATVQYEHWDSGRWPRGGILRTHGPVGDTALERKLLYETYNVSAEPVKDTLVPFPAAVHDHACVDWEAAFNVDPACTEDVDDIFAWRSVEDTTHFMIAIADVSAWVPADCAVDRRAHDLAQTLYDNGDVVTPMLPPSLSTRTASLRCDGMARPVIGLVFVIRDGEVVSQTWHKYMVTLTRAYTYDSMLADVPTATKLRQLLESTCNVSLDPADSHDWVAQAMIKYNHAAAQLLSAVGLGILRRHSGTRCADYASIATESGCSEIGMFGMAAGEYCIGSALQTAHAGLDLDVYCHASSPLRRYADLVNQRLLKYLQFGECGMLGSSIMGAEEVVTHLNSRARAAKALERELWFLGALQPDKITEAEGICLKLKDASLPMEAGRWVVYVPAWKRKITGCVVEGAQMRPGRRCIVRAYCDLRRPAWRDRIVCQLALK